MLALLSYLSVRTFWFGAITLGLFAHVAWAQTPLQKPPAKQSPVEQRSEQNYDEDEPCPGTREKTGETRYREYIVRTYRHPNPFGCFEILKNGRQVHSEVGLVFQIGGSPDLALTNKTKMLPIGQDVTGLGRPNLLIGDWTGGAHCCFNLRIFELEPELRLLTTINAEHSGLASFEDVDGDGRLELVAYDWAFAYWRTSFAESPAPAIILRFRDGKFHLAENLMRKPAPSTEELKRKAKKVHRLSPGDRREPDNLLWATMLDLIYTGNAPKAWEFFDMAWPSGRKGKEEFLQDFCKQLERSLYREDVNALNGGQVCRTSIQSQAATVSAVPQRHHYK